MKLTPSPISGLGYNETITPGGEYTYNVTAVYEPNFESCPEEAEVTLCVGCDLDAPQCILAEVQESDIDVLVAWCTPGAVTPEYWISYFTDLTHLSWAVPERATLYNVTDFGAEYPVEITQLAHVFYEHPSYPWGADQTFKFKVYAADGTTMLYESAEIAALQYPDETVVVLDEAIAVDGDFYLSIAGNAETGMPSSAAIEDLTNSHGYVGAAGAWEAYDLEWASSVKIRTAAADVMLQPNNSGHAVNSADVNVAAINETIEVRDLNRAILLGYNVWRDGDVVAYVPAPDTFYMDMNLAPDSYTYCVTAIYDEGESTPICAEPVTVEAKGMIAGTVVDGLTGTVLEGVTVTAGEYTATTGYDGYYEMEVMSGTIEVMAEKAGYTTSVKTAEVYYDQTTTVDFNLYEDGVVLMLPFYEPWNDGFEAQGWSFDPEAGNWLINETVGVDAPSAEFNWSPSVTEYSYALVTNDIVADGASNVALAFDLQLSDYAADGNEMMTIEVFNGTDWNEVVTFANNGNIDWTSYTFDISEYAIGNIFNVRFVAHGLDSYNINYWNIDNVKIYEQVLVNVYGTVTELATGNPVEGVEITVEGYDPVFTDAAGTYSVQVETGTYNLTAEMAGYNVENETATVEADYEWNVELTAPVLVVDPDQIGVEAIENGPDVVEIATVYNNGNGQLDWNVTWAELQMTAAENLTTTTTVRTEAGTPEQEVSPKVTKLNGAVDEIWDVQFQFDAAAAAGGVMSQAGVEFDGQFFYTTIWNGTDILKFYANGNYIETMAISGASGLRDLAWDGEFLYAGASSTTIYQIDPSDMSVVGTISTPENVRAIAYDDGADGFWICDWSTDLYLVGRDGAILNVIANPGVESNYGMAYDGFTGAPTLWLFSQGGSGADFVQVDINSGTLTGVSHNALADLTVTGTSTIAGGAFTTVDYLSGTVTLGGMIQADQDLIFGYELAEYDQWLSFNPTNGTVMPGESQEVEVIFNAADYPEGTHKEALATFHSTPDVGVEELTCIMDVIRGINDVEGIEVSMYPVPANDFVNIELSDNVQSIRILNYAGQVVYDQIATDTFVRIDVREYTAGAYMVEFTTNDGEVFNKRLVVTK